MPEPLFSGTLGPSQNCPVTAVITHSRIYGGTVSRLAFGTSKALQSLPKGACQGSSERIGQVCSLLADSGFCLGACGQNS